MKKILLPLFFFTLICSKSYAQKDKQDYQLTDNKALHIPVSQTYTTQNIADYMTANFNISTEKARAIFIWTASNIEYDIENMYAINFYEKTEDKINKSLKTRKGVCINYAAVFTDICKKAGLQSYIIEGYTRQNGFADYIPHAWCVTYLDTAWYIFDPTWGSGYISNNKFVKKINNKYFKASPTAMIKSHMPFDPLWQFLNYTVSNQEFYEDSIRPAKGKPFFSFKDSLRVYEAQSDVDQMLAAARRIEQNGVKNGMIFDRLEHLKRSVEIYNQNQKVNAHNEAINGYNEAVVDYNNAVNEFNDYVTYRNNEFKPKETDADIQAMIDIPDKHIKSCIAKLDGIKHPDEATASLIISIQKSVEDLKNHIDEQKEFLNDYFKKGALGRKMMFRKITWMGMPLN